GTRVGGQTVGPAWPPDQRAPRAMAYGMLLQVYHACDGRTAVTGTSAATRAHRANPGLPPGGRQPTTLAGRAWTRLSRASATASATAAFRRGPAAEPLAPGSRAVALWRVEHAHPIMLRPSPHPRSNLAWRGRG